MHILLWNSQEKSFILLTEEKKNWTVRFKSEHFACWHRDFEAYFRESKSIKINSLNKEKTNEYFFDTIGMNSREINRDLIAPGSQEVQCWKLWVTSVRHVAVTDRPRSAACHHAT